MLSFRRSRAGISTAAAKDGASSSSGDGGATGHHRGDATILSADGDLKFEVARGGNNSLPSYQEVSGAPVETLSPLGYSVGPVTVVFLNISQMIGTGVYSTREFSREVVISSLELERGLDIAAPSSPNH